MKYLMISVKLALLLTTATGWTQQQPAGACAALPPTTPPIELECWVLTGRVTDPFAYPLTGAIIMLRSPGKGFSPDAFSTNAEGHYMVTAKQTIPRNTIIPRNTRYGSEGRGLRTPGAAPDQLPAPRPDPDAAD